jgi:signal transduction histidine kinase
MDNAVKYTGSNGVITLSVFLEGNFACVSIADNGPGIPKEELPKIFDRFYSRNRGSKEAESKSHGLGLALAKIIVLAHGGKITVKSTLNIGTEFIVKIPVK